MIKKIKITFFRKKQYLLLLFLLSLSIFTLNGCFYASDSASNNADGVSTDKVLGRAEDKSHGIELDICNPFGRLKYCDGYLYVPGASQLMGGGSDNNSAVTEWGGVQRINTSTYEKSDVIYPNHSVSDVAVVSSTHAYLIEYISWGSVAIKRFNPETGEIKEGNIADLAVGEKTVGNYCNVNLISMDVDKNGNLWVCGSTAKITEMDGDTITKRDYEYCIFIIDTATDTIEEKVYTNLVPQYLTFCRDKAIVVTATATYSSGAHSIVPIEQTDGERTPTNNLTADTSDMAIDSYGDHFYRIQRYMSDSVMKFHIDNPGQVRDNVNTADPDVIWQFSAMDDYDENDEGLSSTNPHALAIYSESRGFLSRYESSYVWVVNLQAEKQSDFKIGKLDLSAYDDDDGIPEMSSTVIADGKLFIAMQRLYRDSDGIWKANRASSYIAVFNPETYDEIDAGNK